MKRINLLSETTANKIAAGEVVERASSVVKEIVENSLDAESRNIVIEIEESGSKLIRVTDDGIGIHPEDVPRAFLPHGTSKIQSIEDIYTIASFGFRGEALPSIAAISKVKLKSRPKEFEYGKEILIEGGKTISLEDVGCNPGTDIIIEDIFYNTPARQKFLKSPQREKSIINDLVMKLALGNYKTSMTLINDGKQVLKTYGDEELDKTIRILYGREVHENIIYLENHRDIISVYGYIGKEVLARGSRLRQSIFVNKRLIKSPLITAAVENAFKSFYPTNKFPFFAIYIDIFPEYIDPNVHPAKTEIKFLEDRLLFKTVFDSVHSALKEDLRTTFSIPEEKETTFEEEEIKKGNHQRQLGFIEKYDSIKRTETPSFLKESIEASEKYYELDKKSDNVALTQSEDNFKADFQSSVEIKENTIKNTLNQEPKAQLAKFPKLKLVGQCFNSYIICEYLDELYIIDQHAAHEKILFEKYKKNIATHCVNSQILAVPALISLSYDEFATFKENEAIFKNSGFLVEEFGDCSVCFVQF